MTLDNDAEREKLSKEVGLIVYGSNNIVTDICNFIIADRKRICEPLVNYRNFITSHSLSDEAIDQTLKNAGIGG